MANKNVYFKRTKKKLVGNPAIVAQIASSDKFTHFMHKFDGTHAELIINDEIKFITRDGADVTHLVPHLVDSLEAWENKIAYYGVYACELVHLERVHNAPKDSWSASRRVLGYKEWNPYENSIDCVIYDLHEREYCTSKMHDVSYLHRRQFLPKTHIKIADEYEMTSPCRGLTHFHVPVLHNIEKLPESWTIHVEKSKREGFVLCHLQKDVPWDKTFTKLKPLIDIDCVVMGYNMGTVGGKFEGMVGSLEVGVFKDGKLVNIGKLPHMDDDLRYLWTRRMQDGVLFDNYTDMHIAEHKSFVVQAECAEITSGMKMRFPNYVRERTNKEATECLWEQLL